MKNEHFTEEQKIRVMAEWKKSGMSILAFIRKTKDKEGYPQGKSTLYKWSKNADLMKKVEERLNPKPEVKQEKNESEGISITKTKKEEEESKEEPKEPKEEPKEDSKPEEPEEAEEAEEPPKGEKKEVLIKDRVAGLEAKPSPPPPGKESGDNNNPAKKPFNMQYVYIGMACIGGLAVIYLIYKGIQNNKLRQVEDTKAAEQKGENPFGQGLTTVDDY